MSVYEPLLRRELYWKERKELETEILNNPDPVEVRLWQYRDSCRKGKCRVQKDRFTDGEMSQPHAQNQLHIDQHFYGTYWKHKHICFGECIGCIKWERHRNLRDWEWLEYIRQVKMKYADCLQIPKEEILEDEFWC